MTGVLVVTLILHHFYIFICGSNLQYEISIAFKMNIFRYVVVVVDRGPSLT